MTFDERSKFWVNLSKDAQWSPICFFLIKFFNKKNSIKVLKLFGTFGIEIFNLKKRSLNCLEDNVSLLFQTFWGTFSESEHLYNLLAVSMILWILLAYSEYSLNTRRSSNRAALSTFLNTLHQCIQNTFQLTSSSYFSNFNHNFPIFQLDLLSICRF